MVTKAIIAALFVFGLALADAVVPSSGNALVAQTPPTTNQLQAPEITTKPNTNTASVK